LKYGVTHFGLEVHVLTQRITDWFDSRIECSIQSVAASKWLGQMEARAGHGVMPGSSVCQRPSTTSAAKSRARTSPACLAQAADAFC
jgi:hypothetical protein